MNSKALMSAPLLVLSFIFSDSSGMNARMRAMRANVLKPFIEERDRCRQQAEAEHQKLIVEQEQARQQAAAAEAERQRIIAEQEQERQRIIAEQEQERQRFIAEQEQERQRIIAAQEQERQRAEAMQQRLNEEEEQLRQTQREAEEARQARQQMLAAQEQERQQAEQERINKMVDLDKFVDGIALLKQKSMTTISHTNVLFLEKYNIMISMPEGSSKGIKITTDYMLGSKTLHAKSNELTELTLCGLFAQLLDEIGLTGNIFELYRLIPDFPDPNELVSRRRYVFEEADDIIKNNAISLRNKAIYLKSYINDAASGGSKLSILKNNRIDSCEARWFYYFLYSILYESVLYEDGQSSRRVVSSRNSSEEKTCCIVCEVS